MPVCSIVMPVYNCGAYLDAAIKSIFAQTFTDFEMICVNDGSTDTSPSILASFDDPRLRVIHNDRNRGIVYSLNRGIAAMQSDLIVRLDGDDLMAENRLERQLAYMSGHPTLGGAGSFYYVIDETGKVCGTHEWVLNSPADLDRYLDGGGNPVFPHPAMILRKAAVDAVGGYREEFNKCEDVDLFLRMIEANHLLLIQPEYLMYFRTHGSSATATSQRRQFELNELLFSNFHRRRSGLPEIPADVFKAKLANAWMPQRLAREGRFMSRVLLRHQGVAKMRNQRLKAAVCLVGAAACDPGNTFRKVQREVRRRMG